MYNHGGYRVVSTASRWPLSTGVNSGHRSPSYVSRTYAHFLITRGNWRALPPIPPYFRPRSFFSPPCSSLPRDFLRLKLVLGCSNWLELRSSNNDIGIFHLYVIANLYIYMYIYTFLECKILNRSWTRFLIVINNLKEREREYTFMKVF